MHLLICLVLVLQLQKKIMFFGIVRLQVEFHQHYLHQDFSGWDWTANLISTKKWTMVLQVIIISTK